MTRRLVYTPAARDDLDEIFDFIATDNPLRAASYVADIQNACRNLCVTPHLGRERSDLRAGLRILPLWQRIIIAYELPPGRVDILRVFSAGRDYQAIIDDD